MMEWLGDSTQPPPTLAVNCSVRSRQLNLAFSNIQCKYSMLAERAEHNVVQNRLAEFFSFPWDQ